VTQSTKHTLKASDLRIPTPLPHFHQSIRPGPLTSGRDRILSLAAMESEPSFEFDDYFSTPSDWGFPFPPPPSDLPPVQPSHTLQSAIAAAVELSELPEFSSIPTDRELAENFDSRPGDAGLPFGSPSSDLPPVQPSHTSQSAISEAIESWEPSQRPVPWKKRFSLRSNVT
jgi:hypothetical protein